MPAMVDIREFLSHHHLGVVGLDPAHDELSAQLWERLRGAGYALELVGGGPVGHEPVLPHVGALSNDVGGVLVLSPGRGLDVVADCADRGIARVWLHRRLMATPEGPLAVTAGRAAGLTVIDGTCPLLFLDRVPVARQGGRAHRPVERWLHH